MVHCIRDRSGICLSSLIRINGTLEEFRNSRVILSQRSSAGLTADPVKTSVLADRDGDICVT